jgi:hypothetical protein
MKRSRLIVTCIAVFGITAVALAYFTATGTGTASASVGSINPPSSVTATRSGVNVAISWTAASLLSGASVQGYYVKRSDGTTICGSPTLVTGLSCTDTTVTPGTYTYTVTAVYHSIDASATSNSITISLTAPTLSANPSNPSASTSPSFSFSGGGGNGFQCQLDSGTVTACTSPQSYSGQSAGSHTFKVQATLNGSSGPTTTYTWTIDTSAPSITAEPSNPTNSTSASFSFSHTQTAYTFKCQLDGGGFAACTSPRSYSALTSGSHTFQVEAVAADGSTTAATSDTWVIDTVAPTTAITFPATGSSYNSTGWNAGCATSGFCGTASDSGSGVQKALISIEQGAGNYWNGTSFGSATEQKLTASGTTSWTLAFAASNFPADGAYTVRVYGVDNAGNTQSTATSATFTIDNTAPTVTLTKVNGSAVTFPLTTSSAVTSIGGACGTASGDSSTVSWSVSGSATESGSTSCSTGAWTATPTTPLGAAGTYAVTATQSDAAGNTGTSGGKSITINGTTVTKTLAGTYTLTVPAHDTSVSFTLKGAGGGGGRVGASGAAGGISTGAFSVPDSTTSTTFTVVLGGGGGGASSFSAGSGGTSGTGCALGGAGGAPGALGGAGGGGGGATCLYPSGAASSLIVMAGGGGGGGGNAATGTGGAGGGGPSANPGTNTAGAGTSITSGASGGGGGAVTTSGSFPFTLSLTGGLDGYNASRGGTCSGGTCGAGAAGQGVLVLAGAGGGGGGGIASGGGGGAAALAAGGAGGGGGAGYDGGATNFPVTITSASNGGGAAGGASGTAGTAGSVSFTAVGAPTLA